MDADRDPPDLSAPLASAPWDSHCDWEDSMFECVRLEVVDFLDREEAPEIRANHARKA